MPLAASWPPPVAGSMAAKMALAGDVLAVARDVAGDVAAEDIVAVAGDNRARDVGVAGGAGADKGVAGNDAVRDLERQRRRCRRRERVRGVEPKALLPVIVLLRMTSSPPADAAAADRSRLPQAHVGCNRAVGQRQLPEDIYAAADADALIVGGVIAGDRAPGDGRRAVKIHPPPFAALLRLTVLSSMLSEPRRRDGAAAIVAAVAEELAVANGERHVTPVAIPPPTRRKPLLSTMLQSVMVSRLLSSAKIPPPFM